MSCSLRFREVIPDITQTEIWKELTLNTGGTPSTLQDVKVQQRAGGFCYKKPNRFIYWRTNHDVLELEEQSLDVNLVGNRIRYRFTDTPILEGISVHENINTIIILVATVSSVHKLIFKHPNKLVGLKNSDLQASSIFRDATAKESSEPSTFHVINTTPCLPHTSATCLGPNFEARFALALATGSILLVTLDPYVDNITTIELRHDSIVPRFLSGLTEALLGRNSEDNVPVSLVLHQMDNDMYLFSVCQSGQLRAWSCSRANCVSVADISDKEQSHVLGAQKHMLRKTVNNKGDLVLAAYFCYSENSHIVVVQPRFNNSIFTFNKLSTIFIVDNHDLVELVLADGGQEVWCLWVTGTGDSAISHAKSGSWSWVTLEPPPPLILPANSTLDPRQTYIDAIFKPGVFTMSDIQRALAINHGEPEDSSIAAMSLREQVCHMVSQEILDEVSQFDVVDEEYIDVATRCWSRLYSSCVQYHQTGMPALGLLELRSCCMLVIKRHRLSLLRPMDYLESSMLNTNLDTDDGESYLLQVLRSIDPGEEAFTKLNIALHLNTPLEEPIMEIVREMKFSGLQNIEYQSKKQVLGAIASLLKILNDPECSIREDTENNSLRSELGLSAVVCTLDQLVNVRLGVCRSLLVLHLLPQWRGCMPELFTTAQRLFRQLWAQRWACQTPVLKQFLLHERLTRHSILKSAATLAHYTWAGSADQCSRLAKFLHDSREHQLLQELARLVLAKSWQKLLVYSLLESGEPYKAIDSMYKDLAAKKGADINYYIEMIQLFERYNCRDLVLELVVEAVNKANPDDDALAMLRSVSFLHHLALGHYEDAYISLQAQPQESRQHNCLVELASALVEGGHLHLLLTLPFTGMLARLEEFLESRARAREPAAAAVYYNTLYALHINNKNYRKGAAVMWEKGMRAESAEGRQESYAVCLNTITLVEPKYAWIVKKTGKKDHAIEVLEVKDIRREYQLALARSKLPNCPLECSAEEVVGQCVAAGYYKTALRLCFLCGLSYEAPLEALAAACVQIEDDDQAWQWLLLNDVSDLVPGNADARTVAWRLLEYFLNKYEEDNLSTLHKAVATKLISLCVFLPHWLQASYKRRNCAELIRLFLNHGALEQASDLACEFLAASLGPGKELFGLSHALHPSAPPLCLPLNTIDRLLAELKFHKMDGELRKAVDKYLDACRRVSNDKIKAASTLL